MNKLLVGRIDASILVAVVALLLAAGGNTTFWSTFMGAAGGLSLDSLPLLVGTFLIVVLFFNACLTLTSFRYVVKPVLIAMLIGAAIASHFIATYGIVIDKAMIQNVFETDTREAVELLDWHLALRVGLLGVLPSLWIARAEINLPRGLHGLARRGGIAAGSFIAAAVLLMFFFKSLAPTLHEHRELRFLLVPTNLIQAVHGYLRSGFTPTVHVMPLGRDAVKGQTWAGRTRKTLTVIVVGETARAASFSLNGYARQTNPRLSQVPGLINFSHMTSCGTATAVSVPCLFSNLGRDGYSQSKAAGQEGLLDVLAHAGFAVLWRDNNSGCKGVCDRVKYEDVSRPTPGDSRCEGDECFDARLLDGLPELIHGSDKDMVLVLHQKGSHGPAYASRYPTGFGRFGPVCDASQFERCSPAEIQAAYDNTILYTDDVLATAIEHLRAISASDQVDTALLYFSDHGESLGENNVYLHGAPYIFAPREQTEVPMMLWMSDGFGERFRIDRNCLNARRQQAFSHDNLFHSVLGMLDITTTVQNPRLDLFHACVRGAPHA